MLGGDTSTTPPGSELALALDVGLEAALEAGLELAPELEFELEPQPLIASAPSSPRPANIIGVFMMVKSSLVIVAAGAAFVSRFVTAPAPGPLDFVVAVPQAVRPGPRLGGGKSAGSSATAGLPGPCEVAPAAAVLPVHAGQCHTRPRPAR